MAIRVTGSKLRTAGDDPVVRVRAVGDVRAERMSLPHTSSAPPHAVLIVRVPSLTTASWNESV